MSDSPSDWRFRSHPRTRPLPPQLPARPKRFRPATDSPSRLLRKNVYPAARPFHQGTRDFRENWLTPPEKFAWTTFSDIVSKRTRPEGNGKNLLLSAGWVGSRGFVSPVRGTGARRCGEGIEAASICVPGPGHEGHSVSRLERDLRGSAPKSGRCEAGKRSVDRDRPVGRLVRTMGGGRKQRPGDRRGRQPSDSSGPEVRQRSRRSGEEPGLAPTHSGVAGGRDDGIPRSRIQESRKNDRRRGEAQRRLRELPRPVSGSKRPGAAGREGQPARPL